MLAAAGCVSGRLPAIEQYRLISDSDSLGSGVAPAGDGALPGAVAVHRFDTPGIYGNDQIVYRVESSGYGSYPTREWAIPLGAMLGIMAEEELRAGRLGPDAVYDPQSLRHYQFEWRSSVREFEEVNRGGQVYASVHLESRLLRAADDSMIWRGDRKIERLVPDPTMGRIVEALSAAAREALRDLVADARTAAMGFSSAQVAPKR